MSYIDIIILLTIVYIIKYIDYVIEEERNMELKDSLKIFPMNIFIRQKIHSQINEKKDEVIDIVKAKELIEKNFKQGMKSIEEIYGRINLLEVIKGVDKLNKYFDCKLMDGNYAWISKDSKGHYRYFTRSKIGITNSLDLLDILSVCFNKKIKKTISISEKMFGINVKDKWVIKQINKYRDNLDAIELIEKSCEYNNIRNLIGNKIDILKALNEIGNNNILKRLSYNEESIFFVSLSYIKANYVDNRAISTISQVINTLAVLGLINKVDEKNIPIEFINNAKLRMSTDKTKKNHISFFIINNMKKTLNEAERRAKILNDNKIKYYKINKKVITDLFGKFFTDKIYVQKTSCGNKKYKIEKQKITHLFIVSFCENGYVIKEDLLKETIMSYKTFDKLWRELTTSVECKIIKPNKLLKEKFNLKTNYSIVLREKNLVA